MLAGTRIPGDGQQDSGEGLGGGGRIPGCGLEADQDPRGRGLGFRERMMECPLAPHHWSPSNGVVPNAQRFCVQ